MRTRFIKSVFILIITAATTTRTTTRTTTTTTTQFYYVDGFLSRPTTGVSPTKPSTLLRKLQISTSDNEEVIKTVAIALTLGGGLIPPTISANQQMIQAISGRKGYNHGQPIQEDDPNNTFDPTAGKGINPMLRQYVIDSGATGPSLPKQELLFATDNIPLVDIIAVLGRIRDKNSIVDWTTLPSATRQQRNNNNSTLKTTTTPPPMWLPRQSFKVLIRQAKFLGWPNDIKTGLPLGGESLKQAELSRISQYNAQIGDAALDAVFDTWAWGASIATPDKVEKTLQLFMPTPNNEVDLDAFVNAAIRGRSQTVIAAMTFILIQLLVYGSLFIRPAMNMVLGKNIT